MNKKQYKIKVIKVTERIIKARQAFRFFINRHSKNNKFLLYSGGSFAITPILITILLVTKNIFFNISSTNHKIIDKITQERIKSAQLTLDFAQYQNHQKVLDLQNQYITDYNYINSDNIIEESVIEFL
jgi:hypothetical protein